MEMEDWVSAYRRRKWRLAGKLARCNDNRWSKQILEWRPDSTCFRLPGRPKTRWIEQVEKFAGGDWMDLAADSVAWGTYEDAFVQFDRIWSLSSRKH